MDPLFGLSLRLPERGEGSRLQALQRQLREAIVDGRLRPGLRLPATRALASLAGVSRNTAVAAYELLLAEGYVQARRGAGTFVSTTLIRRPGPAASAEQSLLAKLVPLWRDAPPPEVLPVVRHDFRPGHPDHRLFPYPIWRRLTLRVLRDAERGALAAVDPQGDPALREAIARHASATRAVACDAAGVFVTAGAQQAFELLASVLITPGRSVVALENPCYESLRATFAASGARLHDVPVDAKGLRVDALPRRYDVVAVSPSHQSPLGVTLSADRRGALLASARRADAVVIEDDYDGEFHLHGRALDALQTLDADGRVFYVGTFSKSLLPAMRIGFVVVPHWARAAVLAARQHHNWHAAALTQATLAAFIQEGHLARHVRRMRALYVRRHERMRAALQRHFGARLQLLPAAAGLHLCAALSDDERAEDWVRAAAGAGIRLRALSRQVQPPVRLNGLIFGYGLLDEAAIEPAVRALAQAVAR